MLKAISTIGNFGNVTLTSTDAGAGAGPLLDLYRNSASPAASDTIGEIEFNGQDSAGNKQQYALIHGSILSPTSTAETGQIHFETATGGASTEKMIIGTTNLVINDIGAIYNVRIEGDTDANLFFTDATNSRVGIGIITPAEKLDVVGNIKLSGNVIPASGFGIDFAATAGTGTSELLADYEEGTWTPVVGGNATYTFQEGYYTKVGRVVTVTFVLIINVLGTGSTTIMSGLPFASGAPNRSGGSMAYWTDLATNVLYLAPFVTTGNSSLSFISQTASGVTVTDSAAIFGNSASVQGTVTYMTS